MRLGIYKEYLYEEKKIFIDFKQSCDELYNKTE